MKKILIFLLLFFSIFSNSFSYSQTKKDSEILKKIFIKLEKQDNNKIKKLNFLITNFLKKHKKNERLIFLLKKINLFLEKKLKNNNFLVLKVIDGDTIKINYFGKKEYVRLIGIDAPENSKTRKGFIECYGNKSKKFLEKLILGKKIYLEFDQTQAKRDKYNRLLAYIFFNKKNINNLMIKSGFAKEYTYKNPYKYQKLFKKSQDFAKKNKIGIYNKKNCNKNYSKKYNIKIKYNTKCLIKGNISYKTHKKIYHLPYCPSYKKIKINILKNEKWFCSEEEAIKNGFKKASNCY